MEARSVPDFLQGLNKVSSAVQLRYEVAHSNALPEQVRQRLIKQAGRRMTSEAVLVIEARQFRTQEQNRQAAIERLVGLIRRASEKPKLRKTTHPSLASQQRRLEKKRRRSQVKRMRRLRLEE